MKLFVTGSTGFVGEHLMREYGKADVHLLTPFTVHGAGKSMDIFNPDCVENLRKSLEVTHVLHLAWFTTGENSYDTDQQHHRWAERTFSLVQEFAESGIVSYVPGTGLESDFLNPDLSEYGRAKRDLKSWLSVMDPSLVRWISMPYIFSLFHKRPRVLKAGLTGIAPSSPETRHDYLEIRDVVRQLHNVVAQDNPISSSVTSGCTHSNRELISSAIQFREASNYELCSCQEEKATSHWGADLTFHTRTFFSER